MLFAPKASLILLLAAPVLMAASPEDASEPEYTRLSLSGMGYAEQSIEFVTVSASTTTFSTSASGAMRGNAAAMARLRGQLARLGVARDDFQTASFNFEEGRSPEDVDGERPRGYLVRHQLTVTLRNPDNVGAAMDAMVEAGAKNLSINRYWGYSRDVDPQSLKRARAEAIQDAQTRANDYAQSVGMRIRRIVSINDQGGYTRQMQPAMMITAPRAPTQIDTRPATVLASVNMVFELEK